MEDDEPTGDTMRDSLEVLHYRVAEISNGLEVLELYSSVSEIDLYLRI